MSGSMTQGTWRDYCRLMRIDKPIGSLLLLWPTLWALWVAGGGMPDLRYSPYLAAAEAFRRPPLDGVLATRGMPAFSDSLQAAEVDAIRAYVIRMAHSFAPQADAPEAAAQ